MEKRKIIFGSYDTALHGLWTLNQLAFSDPVHQSNLVTVPGRDGALDLSTVLNDGEPNYGTRTLSARFESSEGTRMERNARISAMVNQLDGRRMDIILPDDPTRYVTGRVSVMVEYSDMAHAAVNVSAVCDPWRYNRLETVLTLEATNAEQLTVLPNSGRRIAVPSVTVKGSAANVLLACNGDEWELPAGEYRLLGLKLPGFTNTPLTYSGTGTVVLAYREAIL